MVTGTQVVTGDVVVGVSGKPIRIFAANWVSGGTAGVLVLRNGTGAGDTVYLQITGTADVGVVYNIHEGMLFPDGCFYDHDANSSHISITYALERR